MDIIALADEDMMKEKKRKIRIATILPRIPMLIIFLIIPIIPSNFFSFSSTLFSFKYSLFVFSLHYSNFFLGLAHVDYKRHKLVVRVDAGEGKEVIVLFGCSPRY